MQDRDYAAVEEVREASDLERVADRIHSMIEMANQSAGALSGFLGRSGRGGPPLDDPKGAGGTKPVEVGHFPSIFDHLDILENRLGRIADYARGLNRIG